MKIKQLTYTSSEKGWYIERALGTPNDKECRTFSRISSQNRADTVLYAFDFSDDVGVLSRSVPYGTDSVNRPRYYVHGYVVSGGDCDELLQDYSAFLGMDYFASGQQDVLCDTQELHSRFEGKVVCPDLRCLIACVYEAVLKNKSLEICTDEQDRELLIKKIMNTVYGYLPPSLRKFVSFSSGVGNIMRTVTATDICSGLAGMTFNVLSGETSGLQGTYSEFVDKLFSDKKDFYLSEFEKQIKGSLLKNLSDTMLVESAIQNILFEAQAAEPVSTENALSRLVDVLNRKRYSNSVDAAFMCKLIDVICAENIVTSEALNKKLVEVFNQTTLESLKECIVHYIVQRHTGNSDRAAYESIAAYEKIDVELYTKVMQKAMGTATDAFLWACAERAINDAGYSRFIRECCQKNGIDRVLDAIVGILAVSQQKEMLLKAILKTDFHADVIHYLLKDDTYTELVWKYLTVVYSDADNLTFYKSLDSELIRGCERIFYQEIGKHRSDALKLIDKIYTELGCDVYPYVEEQLMQTFNEDLLQEFYAEWLSAKVTDVNGFECHKARMHRLGLSVEGYVSKVASEYARLCFAEAKQNHESDTAAIKRIMSFIEGALTKDIPAVQEIKRAFWQSFDWHDFDFSEDIRSMSLPDEEKSVVANAVVNLAAYASGKAAEVDAQDIAICKQALCRPNAVITAREQDYLLAGLKAYTLQASEIDIDFWLLINYSNKRRRVDFKNAYLPADVLCVYLQYCVNEKNSMMYVPGVFDSLHKYVKSMCKKAPAEDSDSSLNYRRVRMLLKKYQHIFVAEASGKLQTAKLVFVSGSTYVLILLALICLIATFTRMNGGLLINYAIAFASIAIVYIRHRVHDNPMDTEGIVDILLTLYTLVLLCFRIFS